MVSRRAAEEFAAAATGRNKAVLGSQFSEIGFRNEDCRVVMAQDFTENRELVLMALETLRDVGPVAKAVMARGELVSDDLVCNMVRGRLALPDCGRGYVLDGFPRTAAQAGWLDALLDDRLFDNSRATRAWPIVISLEVDYNQLLLRITGRRSCPTDGRIYNVHFQPPRVDELCDLDGTKLVTRNDDRLEVIQPRLTAYQEQTRPVADYYQRTGRLIAVDGELPIDQVTEKIFRILEDHHAA